MIEIRLILFVAFVTLALTPANDAQTPPPKTAPEVDLQKQVEDALKELDKLEKLFPETNENAKKVRQQIDRIKGGLIPRDSVNFGNGRLGVLLQKPTPVLIEQLSLAADQGQVVLDVRPDSPAAKVGILKFDVIVELNGKPAPSELASFQDDVYGVKPGVDNTVVVVRRTQRLTLKGLTLSEAPPEPAAPKVQPRR